jgi:RHS repeat-associated protein
LNGATDAIKLAAATFTGIDQTTPLVATSTNTGFGSNPAISHTTTVANALVAATLSRFSTTDAATNRTSIYNDSVTSTLGAASYQLATSTGSYSDTYTGSASADWSMIMAEFRPATSSGGSGTTTTYIVHPDHLGGTNVVSDNDGDLAQTVDYYPYGSLRINTRNTNLDEKRKFTGHEYDSEVGLNYMMARYQEPARGQFLSQDPAHLFVGDNRFKDKFGRELEAHLSNPQHLNSYSYAGNNSIVLIDENGELVIAYSYSMQGIVGGGITISLDPAVGV